MSKNIGLIMAIAKAVGGSADPAVIEQAVTDWLNDHPEATTTVEDGSITEAKLAADVLAELGEIDTLKEAIESLNPPLPPAEIELVLGYINSNGSEDSGTPSGNYCITDFIDLDDVVAISYAGEMGSSAAVFWYNSSKTFISSSLVLGDRTAYYENILTLRPSNAKYVRMQSKTMNASNPPDVTPEVTVFYDRNYIDALGKNIVGDGVTDDTNAVQRIVNMCESVKLPHREKILITDPIHVRLGYARIIDGNGANIIIDDDFYALTVTGTLTGSSSSTGMNTYVMQNEADTLITNFRITSDDGVTGGGIEVTNALKLKLIGNYIFNVENGIRFYGQNRDCIISDNHLHSIYASGILFDDDVNLHQCNISNNILMYAHDMIHINTPQAIANLQINGNDIELGTYPPETYGTAKCIYIVADSGTSQLSEIEIVGNTIQGHEVSAYVIVLEGVDDHLIGHVSIVGNHISNSQDSAISMEYVENITISGNNYSTIKHYVYELDGECSNIVISGESGIGINQGTVAAGGKIHAASTATLANVLCKNIMFTPNDGVSIATNNVTDVDLYDEKDITVSGSTPSITAVPNARYICGEVSTLSFTPCSSGACAVVFTSGSTPTTLTVPNTVKWADSFDPTSIDASTTYEISVLNGTLGVAAKWA